MGATALTGDPDVRPVYERVQRRRLDYLTHLYDDLGFRGVEARRRAITTYGAFLGSVQIVLLGDKSLRTKAQLERQVALFEELLIPKPELG